MVAYLGEDPADYSKTHYQQFRSSHN